MVAGETFVLPAGAEVVSVTDSSVIESTCDETFEEKPLLCYKLRWVINVDSEGSINYLPLLNAPVIIPEANNAWDNEGGDTPDISISYYSIAGQPVEYGGLAVDLASLESALAASPLGGLLNERKYNSEFRESVDGTDAINWNGNFSSGYTWFEIAFKAIKEVGDTVYLQFRGESGNIGDIARYYALEIDCADYPVTTQVASSGGGTNPASTTTTTTANDFAITTTTTTTIP